MMRRRPAMRPSPGMAVPAIVYTTARRKLGSFCRIILLRACGRRAIIGELPAPRSMLELIRHQHPSTRALEVKTRSTIRAKPGQYAILARNADRRARLAADGWRFDKLSAHCGALSRLRPGSTAQYRGVGASTCSARIRHQNQWLCFAYCLLGSLAQRSAAAVRLVMGRRRLVRSMAPAC